MKSLFAFTYIWKWFCRKNELQRYQSTRKKFKTAEATSWDVRKKRDKARNRNSPKNLLKDIRQANGKIRNLLRNSSYYQHVSQNLSNPDEVL